MQITETLIAIGGAAALAACGGGGSEANSADANLTAMDASPMAVGSNKVGSDMNAGMGTGRHDRHRQHDRPYG